MIPHRTPTPRPGGRSMARPALLAGWCLLLLACLTLPWTPGAGRALAVETMERGGPPPPTPGWPYGPVSFSMTYSDSPAPHYDLTMSIKSPANIWFRYIYTTGPGPRWYHVSSGHKTRLFPGCTAVQAFGVNLSDFGPDSTQRIPWRGGESPSAEPRNENEAGSGAP